MTDDSRKDASLSRLEQLDEEVLKFVIEYAGDGIVVQDERAIIEWANAAYCDMFGCRLEDIVGRNPLEYCLPLDETPAPEAIAAFRYDMDPATEAKLVLRRNRRSNGELFWIQMSEAVIPPRDDSEGRVILICRDVTDAIEQREQLEETQRQLFEAAETDMLTGLLNREGIYRKLELILEMGRAKGPYVGLLHIDLDRFKSINDTHGHSAGDAVLYTSAERMRREVADNDLIARIGGDEFIIVRPDALSGDEMRDLAARLTCSLSQPVEWDDRPLACGASIGIAVSEPQQSDAEELVSDADYALYEAKAAGRGAYRSFDSALRQQKDDQQQLAHDIQGAMRQGAFEPYLQPIVDFARRRIVAFEALVRWNHPTRGLLVPGQFLKLVSDLALAHELDRIMLSLGLDAQAEIQRQTGQSIPINLNAHPTSLGHAGHADEILLEIDRRNIDPSQVMIEVLETTRLSHKNDPTARAIAHLAAGGVKVALDDYGVGYAGIANLTIPGLTCIKLDRSLVRDATAGGHGEIILRTIAGLCSELGYQLVCEGIERPEDAAFLFTRDCHIFQGYWIARPMPLAQAIEWVRDQALADLADAIDPADLAV